VTEQQHSKGQDMGTGTLLQAISTKVLEHDYQHSCALQSMKKISQSNTSVTLKCRGCNARVTVKLNSSIYVAWQRLQKRDK